MSVLFRNLIRFGRLLHAAGLDVRAGRMIDVASALDHIDIGRRSDLYSAESSVRCTGLVSQATATPRGL